MAWIDNSHGNWEIYFALIDEAGVPLHLERVTDSPNASRFPSVAWSGDDYAVAWQDNRNGNDEIYLARLDADGGKVGLDARITAAAAGSSAPSLTWSGEEYGVVWHDSRHGAGEVFFKRIDASGAAIGPDIRITNEVQGSGECSLVWSGDRYAIAWQDYRDLDWEIYAGFVNCCGNDVDGDLVGACEDCADDDAAVYPGATQLCDGINTDCSHADWPEVPEDEDDGDSDGYVECEDWVGSVPGIVGGGDCYDFSSTTYPDAPEVNNGLDDQCPGDAGSGLVDEVSGVIGFFDAYDPDRLEWDHQDSASVYEIARSTSAGFDGSGSCDVFQTSAAFWVETANPPDGELFHYLVRAAGPFPGSWGADAAGVERATVCP